MNKIMHPIAPEELMAYLDGELTAARATATAAHLGECAECQGLVAELRSVSQTLQSWEVEAVESATPEAIEKALTERQPKSRGISPTPRRSWRDGFGRRWSAVAWMGGVAAVFLVMFVMSRFQGRETVFSQVGSQLNQGYSYSGSDRDRLAARLEPPSAPQSAAPINGRDKLQQFAKLQGPPPARLEAKRQDQSSEQTALSANGPMIIRTAQINLIAKEFDKARTNLEAILKRHRGYVGELRVDGIASSGRKLTATLRVPADQLDAALTEIKALGRVDSESQGGQDVTSQYVDLQARLSNARNTEQRLTDLLRNRTGKLSDVLEVETELDRVRGEIEQMEAERKNMSNQVSYATLSTTITEDYQAQLQVVPPSTSTRLGNAAIEGYRTMVDGVLGLALFLLANGPSLLLWGAILFFPARFVWKKVRSSFAS